MKEKILDNIPGLAPEDKVIIKKLNYGEKSRLAGLATETTVIKRLEKTTVDTEKSRIYTLVLGIKEAPFFSMADEKHRYNAIMNLDDDTGTYLLNEIQLLNNAPIEKEIKKS